MLNDNWISSPDNSISFLSVTKSEQQFQIVVVYKDDKRYCWRVIITDDTPRVEVVISVNDYTHNDKCPETFMKHCVLFLRKYYIL